MNEKLLFMTTLVLVFAAGALTAFLLAPEILVREVKREPERVKEPIDWNATEASLEDGVKAYIVGTTREGEGMVSPAWVRAEKGSDKILVDIDNLFFWVDIQHSIRTASAFAKEYLGVEKGTHDLTYTIDLNASIVGGPSAGGTLTVATIAALQNRSIREDVVMTGTVEPGGKVGRVGGILPKAKAAEEAGFEKFLVPEGQSVQVTYTREESCRSAGGVEICRTEYVEERVDVNEEVEVEVVEVSHVEDALKHFT